MKPIISLYTLILLLCFLTSIAQTGDCSNAIILQNKNDISFTFSDAENLENDMIPNSCTGSVEHTIDEESTLTYWFEWDILKSGTFHFTLSQQIEFYDLDFILYKVTDINNPCDEMETIRCMFSGPTITNGEIEYSCSMETGLSPLEEDTYENPGCINNSNNFLQEVNAIEGEKYKLVVIDFSNLPQEPILFEMCGTALIGSEDSECFFVNVENESEPSTLTYPNPVNDRLYLRKIDPQNAFSPPFTIYNQMGQIIMEKSNFISIEFIDTQDLSPGIYYIKIGNAPDSEISKFVKQ